MAGIGEIPRLIREFIDLAKAYLEQETLGQARKLGRFAGLSVGAGVAFAFGLVLIAIAVVRGLTELFPEGAYYEALAYALAAFILVVFIAILIRLGPRGGSSEGGSS